MRLKRQMCDRCGGRRLLFCCLKRWKERCGSIADGSPDEKQDIEMPLVQDCRHATRRQAASVCGMGELSPGGPSPPGLARWALRGIVWLGPRGKPRVGELRPGIVALRWVLPAQLGPQRLPRLGLALASPPRLGLASPSPPIPSPPSAAGAATAPPPLRPAFLGHGPSRRRCGCTSTDGGSDGGGRGTLFRAPPRSASARLAARAGKAGPPPR